MFLTILLAITLAAGLFVITVWFPGRLATVSPEIRVFYSSSYTNSIRGLQPLSGSTFLVVHLLVENRGYQNFTATPFRDMFVLIGGEAYDVSAAYIFLSAPFQTSNLKNNESANGDVAFEVPQGTTSFTPQWRLPSDQGIRLSWVPS